MIKYYVCVISPNCLMFNNLNLKFPKCSVQTSIAIHRLCGIRSAVFFNEVGNERSRTAFAICCCSDMAFCSRMNCYVDRGALLCRGLGVRGKHRSP